MRTLLLSLASCGLLALAGCTSSARSVQRPQPSATSVSVLEHPTHAAGAGPLIPAVRPLHLYVDAARSDSATAANQSAEHARTVALSLGELLREHGYDVRSAEASAPQNDAGRTSSAIAGAIAAGQVAPETSRAITYLRPNSPSLLLFVRLDDNPTETGKAALVLGAFLADSASGAIVWSNRVTLRQPASDAALRLLAARLLENLPARPQA